MTETVPVRCFAMVYYVYGRHGHWEPPICSFQVDRKTLTLQFIMTAERERERESVSNYHWLTISSVQNGTGLLLNCDYNCK